MLTKQYMKTSDYMNPCIRLASTEDAVNLQNLYSGVRSWAEKKEFRQAIDPCTLDELNLLIDQDAVYVCEDGGPAIAASFTLRDFVKEEVRTWMTTMAFCPKFSLDLRNTLRLNRLAVARRRAGDGLGYCILDRACEVVREKGKSRLFLSCWAGNTKLRAYYTCAGFSLATIARKKENNDYRLAVFLREC
jgi:GNAT superfamily N-acetyltransferase